MFRKLLLGGAASLALLSPMALPSSADAHEHHYRRHVHHRACRVYYRDPCRPGWVLAGSCYGHREAERIAASYRCRGFQIWVR